MSFVVDGEVETVQGIASTTWHGDPQIALGPSDKRPRTGGQVTGIVHHTTKGLPGGKFSHMLQDIRPGFGPSTDAGRRVTDWWSKDAKGAGAHLIVDFDGRVFQTCDLLRDAAYHAGSCNERTIGVEIVQGARAELYAGQLDVVVVLTDWLTRRFGVQRQMPRLPYRGRPWARLADGAVDFCGVWGHRDSSANRGEGDPGDAIMAMLAASGYEQFDLDQGEDRKAWQARQQTIGVKADGNPGQKTRAALVAAGYAHGLWKPRPGDRVGA